MKIINKNEWNRKEIFEMFSKLDYPFYSVTIPIDVTNVKRISKDKGLSFYFLMIWICTKSLNSIPEFRFRIRGEEIVELDNTSPSFTNMKRGEDIFQITTMPWDKNYTKFCLEARKKSEEQVSLIENGEITDGLIYISCVPWFDFTALTNEHNFNKDDTIPRLAWGKYYEDKERLFIHMSIEVNHRTIDGFHIGKFKEAIDNEVYNLK